MVALKLTHPVFPLVIIKDVCLCMSQYSAIGYEEDLLKEQVFVYITRLVYNKSFCSYVTQKV